jgi:anti-sigma-K factor RskA
MILLYAAGTLDAGECGGLREHLAGGCPQCAGYLAEAEAALALLPHGIGYKQAPAGLKDKILRQARAELPSASGAESATMRISSWDRVVLPAAIAAVLAVAVTLLVVRQVMPTAGGRSPDDQKTIASLEGRLLIAQREVTDQRHSFEGMKFAELTGTAQPRAVGHVFLDTKMNNWYFFTCGMKPAPDGKTYELWLIHDGQKIPAGTFDVDEHGGTATLLGTIPHLTGGAGVTLAVTDEPANGPHAVPTGSLQIKGNVE